MLESVCFDPGNTPATSLVTSELLCKTPRLLSLHFACAVPYADLRAAIDALGVARGEAGARPLLERLTLLCRGSHVYEEANCATILALLAERLPELRHADLGDLHLGLCPPLLRVCMPQRLLELRVGLSRGEAEDLESLARALSTASSVLRALTLSMPRQNRARKSQSNLPLAAAFVNQLQVSSLEQLTLTGLSDEDPPRCALAVGQVFLVDLAPAIQRYSAVFVSPKTELRAHLAQLATSRQSVRGRTDVIVRIGVSAVHWRTGDVQVQWLK